MERRGSRLGRRQFVVGAAGLGLAAGCGRLLGQTQPPPTAGRVYRLGYLSGNNPTDGARNLVLFRQALRELGYVEGQNLSSSIAGARGAICRSRRRLPNWLAALWISSS